MDFIENQTITFLTPKLKTSIMVYINSKGSSRFKAILKICFVRYLYVRSQHFGYKPHFIFSKITHYGCSKHLF